MSSGSRWFALVVLLGATHLLVGAEPARSGPMEAATAAPGLYAVFETSLGDFACQLEPEKAPIATGNFVGLAEGTRPFKDPRTGAPVTRRFYDGLKFHRVLPGLVVQGGDPQGDGSGGPGYDFIEEFDPSLRFDAPGVMAMASAGSDRNGSQFFVTLAPAPHLDGKYTIFGRVVAGFEVVQSMADKPRLPDRETPVTDIVMRKVRIVRSGSAAQSFDAAAAFARQDEIRAKRDAARNKAADEFRTQLQRDEARATRTPSGLRYIVEQPGSGDPPKPGDAISVHCTGWLAADGTRFWSTRDQAEPFRFTMGAGKVIKGWEEAFASMRPGEKRRLIVPPELGYGATGNARAGIPSNATLVFDVELLDIERH